MDTEPVLPHKLDWFIRFAIYALVGVLTFVTQPPGATAVHAQFIGYLVAGVALVTGTVLGALRPEAGRSGADHRGIGGGRVHRGRRAA